MAKAVIHTEATFLPYQETVLGLGYKPASKFEIIQNLNQLEAISPYAGKITSGMESGFTYFENGLRAHIWSSFEERIGTTRVGWDSGKAVLTESNKIVYYGPEIRRTEHFFVRLEHWAHILKARVQNRPTCSHCGRLLKIWQSKNHQYYWYCEGVFLAEKHPWYSRPWDVGLKESLRPETYKFLMDKRERTRKYNIMRVKQNKPKHGTARERKNGWKYVSIPQGFMRA